MNDTEESPAVQQAMRRARTEPVAWATTRGGANYDLTIALDAFGRPTFHVAVYSPDDDEPREIEISRNLFETLTRMMTAAGRRRP